MRKDPLPPKFVSPKVVSATILVLIGLVLAVELADYWWTEEASMHQIDASLIREANRLYAVVTIARENGLTSSLPGHALDRYLSLSKANCYVEVMQYDTLIYRSSNLDPTISLGYHLDESGKPVTLALSSQSMRVISVTQGPLKFFVARTITPSELGVAKQHIFFVSAIILLMILLVPASLIIALYWYRPARALRKHVENLFHQPRHLPLPPVPDFAHHDTNELVDRIHAIIKDVHESRSHALTFSSMASHEMRTPLSIIRNQLESALAASNNEPVLQKAIASAYDEVLRLSGTVEDLLNLSTLQAGGVNLNLTYFSLNEFLKTLYDEALFLTRPKDITAVLAKGPQVTLQADAGRLRQVFLNLLDNSIKNTPIHGRIRITYEVQNDDVVIVFSDTGRGISPENLPRIFDPFFRENSQETEMRGSGLGLSLVKWIIESHGGRVTVESALGTGTSFFIRIPRYHTTPD
jgi:signal transduction histidine kinase